MIDRPVLSVGRRVRLRHLLRALQPLLGPGKFMLDAGCSDGRLAANVASAHLDCEVVAVDIDEDALVAARARAARLPNMRVKRAAIGNSHSLGPFDVIVCADVLEHIADDKGAFAWLSESLRPGGDLLLHVPADPQQHAFETLREAMDEEIAGQKGPHLRVGYSSKCLHELAVAAGLIIVAEEWTFHNPLTRFAADLDTWTYLRHARPVKLALLPLLLGAGELERAPSRSHPGNGLLLHARAPG
jgi:cyclopropane fatty-acyl-phospholipid synthase-like methyltransferase